jgi:hypothetical protein
MILEGKISWVMSSHLGQWHKLHVWRNLWKKVLFVCHIGSPKSCHILQHTWYHWKALELNVLTYNEKGIEYTTTCSLKIHLNQNLNLKGDLSVLLILLENPWWVGLNEGIWKLVDMGHNTMTQDTAVHWVGQQEISLTTTQPRGCSLCYLSC